MGLSASIAATSDGVLVGRGGRIYLANEDGVEVVAIGDLVGAVESSFLSFTCDEDASCGIDLRAASGARIRRLDVQDPSPEFGWAVSSAADGRFALVTPSSSPDGDTSVITLHRPDGTTIATMEVNGYLPFAAGLAARRGWARRRSQRADRVGPPDRQRLGRGGLPGMSVQSDGVLALTVP